MVRKFTFKKITEGEPAKCWYCERDTFFSLTNNKTGEEIWCCSECALKHAKIKRLKNLLKKYPIRKKSSKIEPILCVKKTENNILLGGLNA